MIQFIYDEKNSKLRQREVYLLYYKDKLYCSGNFVVPVKLEIDRNEKCIVLNNILIDSDKKMCEDLFEFIISMKELLDIEDYTVSDVLASGLFYREVYQKDII
jgi:hypothetical protein